MSETIHPRVLLDGGRTSGPRLVVRLPARRTSTDHRRAATAPRARRHRRPARGHRRWGDRRGRGGQRLHQRHVVRLPGRRCALTGLDRPRHPGRHRPPRRRGDLVPERDGDQPGRGTLIVAESFAGCLTAFDIDPDGGLSGRRLWAEGLGPGGITTDAAGAVWTHAAKTQGEPDTCVRVLDGEITHRVPQGQFGFAVMLDGPEGRSLFLCDAEWRGIEGVESALADRTGRILVADAPEPGAGRPGAGRREGRS